VNPLLASIPLVALVAAMTVRAPRLRMPLPAHIALPGAAAAALVLQAFVGRDAGGVMLAARITEGLLTSLIPLSIVFGALVLFGTLKESGAMAVIVDRLERSTPDPVIRVLLIAWAFSYLIEGLSGFGTPAALAAPLLVGMGFPPIRSAAACLVMNTVPVVFGAVGTPIWFGLGELQLDPDAIRSVRVQASLLQCIFAPAVVALALGMLFPWPQLRSRLVPIGAVVLVTVVTSAAVAASSSEFPSITGGLAGLGVAFIAGRLVPGEVGSAEHPDPRGARSPNAWASVVPIIGTVALLAASRIEALGLRGLLNATTPGASLDAEPVGVLSVSWALVVGIEDLFGTDVSWSMPVLYVPFVIPFLVVSLLSAPLLRMRWRRAGIVWLDAGKRLRLPAVALAGALVLVKLMMHGGGAAPVVSLGSALASAADAIHGPLWLAGAPAVGALGSFFSGSATVSNLTFGPVQAEIAERLGLDLPRILALQSIGAAIGNMVCVHNIVAVAAVLGLTRSEPSDAERGLGANGAAAGPEDPVSDILRLNVIPLLAVLMVVVIGAGALSYR